jgi:hypothetical protein
MAKFFLEDILNGHRARGRLMFALFRVHSNGLI